MEKISIIKEIIKRLRSDFETYYTDLESQKKAHKIIETALEDDQQLTLLRSEIDSMIPDTEDDSRWESSYVLNVGNILIALIDYIECGEQKYFDEIVTLFFDTADFKTQQILEKDGILKASEEQIMNHDYYKKEKAWLDELLHKSKI